MTKDEQFERAEEILQSSKVDRRLELAILDVLFEKAGLYDPSDREIDMHNLEAYLQDAVHEVRSILWQLDPNFDETVVPSEKKINR